MNEFEVIIKIIGWLFYTSLDTNSNQILKTSYSVPIT
jgi:hypothetical protein